MSKIRFKDRSITVSRLRPRALSFSSTPIPVSTSRSSPHPLVPAPTLSFQPPPSRSSPHPLSALSLRPLPLFNMARGKVTVRKPTGCKAVTHPIGAQGLILPRFLSPAPPTHPPRTIEPQASTLTTQPTSVGELVPVIAKYLQEVATGGEVKLQTIDHVRLFSMLPFPV